MWCFWTIDNICEKLLYIFSPQFLQWLLTPHIRMTAVLGWPLPELRWIFALISLYAVRALCFWSNVISVWFDTDAKDLTDCVLSGCWNTRAWGRPWQQTCHEAWNNTQTVPPDGHQCTPVQSQWEKNTRSPCLLQTAKNKRTDGKRRYITNTSGLGEKGKLIFSFVPAGCRCVIKISLAFLSRGLSMCMLPKCHWRVNARTMKTLAAGH